MSDKLACGCISKEGVYCEEADRLWAELEEAHHARLRTYADGGRYLGAIERFRSHFKIAPTEDVAKSEAP